MSHVEKSSFDVLIPAEGFITIPQAEVEVLKGFLEHFFDDIKTNDVDLFNALRRIGVNHVSFVGDTQ